MNPSELALFGGPKTIREPLTPYNPIGAQEIAAASEVVASGALSEYLGTWDPAFFGGSKVQEFERAWADHFGVEHAVAVNSNTSGLIAALGAIGIEPGCEVIVSTWTMTASATAALVWNAIPVFADIETDTFNIDPQSIERNITPLTKAIVVTDIFGHGADLDSIMAIATKHRLKVIEDAAQAPGALYKNRHVGTVADIGVYSLNYHKHINTGEGGICVTDDSDLAERMQLIRNHGEAVVEGKGVSDISNIIGFNFRLTELQAAVGIEQLRKLPGLVETRQRAAAQLSAGLQGLTGLTLPISRPDCSHVYYVFPMIVDPVQIGTGRDQVARALAAEGVPVSSRYENIHLLPLYQRRLAYGSRGFPWTSNIYKGSVSYEKGICPIAEKMQDEQYIGLAMCSYSYKPQEVALIIEAFHKVWRNLGVN